MVRLDMEEAEVVAGNEWPSLDTRLLRKISRLNPRISRWEKKAALSLAVYHTCETSDIDHCLNLNPCISL